VVSHDIGCKIIDKGSCAIIYTVVPRINQTPGKYDTKMAVKHKFASFILLIFHLKNWQKSSLHVK